MDLEKVIHAIIDPLVDEPQTVLIRVDEAEEQKEVNILVAAEGKDVAKLIGKSGAISNSIREMLGVAGKVQKKRIHLKFESFDEEEEGK